jgi:enoyl-[acyl-carrier-protein] reductase (NADH)
MKEAATPIIAMESPRPKIMINGCSRGPVKTLSSYMETSATDAFIAADLAPT